MKIQNITTFIVAAFFAGASLSPTASASPGHPPHPPHVVHHTVAHVAESNKVATHEHQVANEKSAPKTHTAAKAASTTAHQSVKTKVSQHPAAERQLKPSTAALEKSVANVFANKKITSLTGYQAINLSHDPNIKGQEAAMIAALVVKVNTAAGPKDVTFTQAELQKKFADKTSGFYDSYINALNKINQTKALPPSQELFGPKGINADTKIYQGNAGDCFFLSAVNGLLKVPGGPEQLKNMIQKVKGQPNQYIVKFPDAEVLPNETPKQLEYRLSQSKPVTVTLTDAEIGMYSHLEKGGKWLAILSVAEATKLHKLHLDPEATIGGGNSIQTLGLFTGKNYVQYRVPSNTPTAAEQQTIIHKIRNAEKNSMPIAIETDDHVLAILGYKNGNLIIKNPWGSAGWYNPKQGAWSSSSAPGYYQMKDDGIFQVPITQISKSSTGFYDIIYHPEDETPVTPTNPTPTAPSAS